MTRTLLPTENIWVFIMYSASVSAAAVAYACCDMGRFDIAPLKEYRSFMQVSRANLASIDKRLDMMKTHRVMAVLANRRDRFCWCYPIAAHRNSPSPGTTFTCHWLYMVVDGPLADRKEGYLHWRVTTLTAARQ